MGSSKKNTIRFGAGMRENPKSSVWRLWAQGNEIYLGARNTVSITKISLHSSGKWRFAETVRVKRDRGGADRAMFKWDNPGEFSDGWTFCFCIVISSIEPLQSLDVKSNLDNGVNWLKPPKEGNLLLCKLLTSDASVMAGDINKHVTDSDTVFDPLIKRNGDHVWLIVSEVKNTPEGSKRIKNIMDKTIIHLKAGSSKSCIKSDTRAHLLVSEDIPSIMNPPSLWDIALGLENVDIEED